MPVSKSQMIVAYLFGADSSRRVLWRIHMRDDNRHKVRVSSLTEGVRAYGTPDCWRGATQLRLCLLPTDDENQQVTVFFSVTDDCRVTPSRTTFWNLDTASMSETSGAPPTSEQEHKSSVTQASPSGGTVQPIAISSSTQYPPAPTLLQPTSPRNHFRAADLMAAANLQPNDHFACEGEGKGLRLVQESQVQPKEQKCKLRPSTGLVPSVAICTTRRGRKISDFIGPGLGPTGDVLAVSPSGVVLLESENSKGDAGGIRHRPQRDEQGVVD